MDHLPNVIKFDAQNPVSQPLVLFERSERTSRENDNVVAKRKRGCVLRVIQGVCIDE